MAVPLSFLFESWGANMNEILLKRLLVRVHGDINLTLVLLSNYCEKIIGYFRCAILLPVGRSDPEAIEQFIRAIDANGLNRNDMIKIEQHFHFGFGGALHIENFELLKLHRDSLRTWSYFITKSVRVGRSVKTLQEFEEKRYELKALAVFDGVERTPDHPDQVILLLHGLNERGLRVYRKLIKYLPDSALVLAPNAPFPLPREKAGKTEYGFCWYFYDRTTKSYFLNQSLAVSWLKEFLASKNISHLPLTIIGFSQGGYLAPLLGHELPQTKLVIGLGCEFRDNLVSDEIKFSLIGLHGAADNIVNVDHSRLEAEKLLAKNLPVTWEMIPDTGHEISGKMGMRVKTILESYGKDRL